MHLHRITTMVDSMDYFMMQENFVLNLLHVHAAMYPGSLSSIVPFEQMTEHQPSLQHLIY